MCNDWIFCGAKQERRNRSPQQNSPSLSHPHYKESSSETSKASLDYYCSPKTMTKISSSPVLMISSSSFFSYYYYYYNWCDPVWSRVWFPTLC
uniref:Uncharacterized protein n=1 Tax=Cannabis sativa TaxID=3483 RepID=A0A803R580_CANSA